MLVEGNFAIETHHLLASDDRVAALITVTIQRNGEELRFDEVHLWRVQDGRLVEMRAIPFDPYVVDEFFARAG
jgi:ketosteroid isomerase-like protein